VSVVDVFIGGQQLSHFRGLEERPSTPCASLVCSRSYVCYFFSESGLPGANIEGSGVL